MLSLGLPLEEVAKAAQGQRSASRNFPHYHFPFMATGLDESMDEFPLFGANSGSRSSQVPSLR